MGIITKINLSLKHLADHPGLYQFLGSQKVVVPAPALVYGKQNLFPVSGID